MGNAIQVQHNNNNNFIKLYMCIAPDHNTWICYYLYMYSVGDKVKCTYIRGTKEYTVTLNLNKKAS